MQKNNKAFTLVELIVVITIVAILGTIAFISLQGYSAKARDSKRTSDISNIKTSLELFFLNTAYYPEPDVVGTGTVYYSGELVWTQGTVGDNVTTNLSRNLPNKPTDPITDSEYTYSTVYGKKEYELLGIYETELAGSNSILNQTNAANGVYTKVDGNYNGVYVKTKNYYIPLPSIITVEDVSSGLILDNENIKSQIVTGGDNFPKVGTKTQSKGKLLFTLKVYDGGIITIQSSPGQKQALAQIIIDAYSGSTLENQTLYKTILETPVGELADLITNLVLNGVIPTGKPTSFLSCEGGTILGTTYSSIEYTYISVDNGETIQGTGSEGITDGTKNYTGDISCDDGDVELLNEVESIDCDSGFVEQGGACVLDECSGSIVANGESNASSQTSSSSWTYNATPGVCTFICNVNYHWDGVDSCDSNTQPCTVSNGGGTQTWSGSWGACMVSWCTTDYYKTGDSTCGAVGNGYYSDSTSISRTACTNNPDTSSRDYTYTSDGNGTNSCTASYTPKCGIDLYESPVGTCSAVGIGYYSANLNNTQSPCTNKPANSTYTSDGNGSNNCSWGCDSGYYDNGGVCEVEVLGCMTQGQADTLNNELNVPGSHPNYTVTEWCDLTSLDRQGSLITTLPPEIGLLTNLQYLNLMMNQIGILPSEIGNLTNLFELNLSQNQIPFLPQEIGNLTSLNYLDLYGNQLMDLPPEMGNLMNLTQLYVGGNGFNEIPFVIFNLQQLQELCVMDNNITYVHPMIDMLQNLTFLMLSGNPGLSTLPNEISNLTNLNVFFLDGTNLGNLAIQEPYNPGSPQVSQTNITDSGNDMSIEGNGMNVVISVIGGGVSAVPQMFDGSDPGLIFSSQESGDEAWHAFDGIVNNGTDPFWGWVSFGGGEVYIGYDFMNPIMITNYTINACMSGMGPTEWKLQGSNDGINWSDLDYEAGWAPMDGQPGIQWEGESTHSFQIDNPDFYQMYRIYGINITNMTMITEIGFME